MKSRHYVEIEKSHFGQLPIMWQFVTSHRLFINRKVVISLITATEASNYVIAIGASTGGTVAIDSTLRDMFARPFAERLNGISDMEESEAKDSNSVSAEKILIAPGNMHKQIGYMPEHFLFP